MSVQKVLSTQMFARTLVCSSYHDSPDGTHCCYRYYCGGKQVHAKRQVQAVLLLQLALRLSARPYW